MTLPFTGPIIKLSSQLGDRLFRNSAQKSPERLCKYAWKRRTLLSLICVGRGQPKKAGQAPEIQVANNTSSTTPL